jgi:hypothetical protein
MVVEPVLSCVDIFASLVDQLQVRAESSRALQEHEANQGAILGWHGEAKNVLDGSVIYRLYKC